MHLSCAGDVFLHTFPAPEKCLYTFIWRREAFIYTLLKDTPNINGNSPKSTPISLWLYATNSGTMNEASRAKLQKSLLSKTNID